MPKLDNKLINSILNLCIMESNTPVINTNKKVNIYNLLNFMPQETATILQENEDFLREKGIDITNPKDIVMCAMKIMFSEFDFLSNQLSDVKDSLLGDRISEIHSAEDFFKKYENLCRQNDKIMVQFQEPISNEAKIMEDVKNKKISEVEEKYNKNLQDEKYYLKKVLEFTTSGINKLQDSFLQDIRVILDMPDEHIAIKSALPFLCKFTGERISKVEAIDSSNHRCKQILAYIEQGYKLQLLVTINLCGNDSKENIESIIEKCNDFFKNHVMCKSNLKKIHGYDDEPQKEFWLTQPKRIIEEINGFKESLIISKEVSMAINENPEEFYDELENITII